MNDPARICAEAWAAGFEPEPELTVSEWADTFRMLSQQASVEPGPYRTDRTPYLRDVMDALSPSADPSVVVLMKGAQVGGTECGNNFLGYVVHHAPGPMLYVQPTVEMAKRISKQRIDPMIEACPALRERVRDPRSRDSGNTILAKEFPRGILVLTGANSAVGLRSMPARYLFLDEVDAYESDVDGEGDPVELAIRRTSTFTSNRKILIVSTPKLKGTSRIERAFERSDKRYYHVPRSRAAWPTSESILSRPPREARGCQHRSSRLRDRPSARPPRGGYRNSARSLPQVVRSVGVLEQATGRAPMRPPSPGLFSGAQGLS
jgi:phage terminase large subunit GpA-like protein